MVNLIRYRSTDHHQRYGHSHVEYHPGNAWGVLPLQRLRQHDHRRSRPWPHLGAYPMRRLQYGLLVLHHPQPLAVLRPSDGQSAGISRCSSKKFPQSLAQMISTRYFLDIPSSSLKVIGVNDGSNTETNWKAVIYLWVVDEGAVKKLTWCLSEPWSWLFGKKVNYL